MKVVDFKAFYHYRIGMQVILGGGRDFVAYVSPLLEDEVEHVRYEPEECGGQGLQMPHAAKLSYADAKAQFGRTIEELEAQGLHWRN